MHFDPDSIAFGEQRMTTPRCYKAATHSQKQQCQQAMQ